MNERFFLIDCGEGTQIQIRKNKLSPAKIHHIFISHLHGDHVFGLFGLLSSLGLMGRNVPLNIYGPGELGNMMKAHLGFFGPLPYEIVIHKVAPGEIIYENAKMDVTAFPLKHRTQTFGYLFREKPFMRNIVKQKIEAYSIGLEDILKIKKGADFIDDKGRVIPNSELTHPPWRQRSYVYLSDTAFYPEVAKYAEGADLLYHEATFLEKDTGLAKQTFHSTASQAAEFAKLAHARKLLIGHFSTRYKRSEAFEEEAGAIFSDTVAVKDGDRFIVEQQREEGEAD